MRHTVRAAAAAALLLASVGLAPSVASAVPAPTPTPTDDCQRGVDDYGAPLPCEVVVTTLSPVCDNDVPRLRYVLTALGSSSSTVDVTWVNPGGDDVVYEDQPLDGSVLWPGAVVGTDGTGADWPGWRLEGGTWVQGDEYDWVRPDVTVRFDVNPSTTVTVAYPPSSPQCLTAPPRSDVLSAVDAAPAERSEVLAATGAQVGLLAAAAAALVGLGAGAVAVRRRRQG
ncbi:LPXTG cell wall anchor domain-containing protein [Cellulomonas sp. NPDC057328]|uniref:LPXTG cell wall anchor domain-containing protein n=1 Tax=Cellulomonas sp. NPDC057328 TaxID=3346101 RepID=UPI00363A1581